MTYRWNLITAACGVSNSEAIPEALLPPPFRAYRLLPLIPAHAGIQRKMLGRRLSLFRQHTTGGIIEQYGRPSAVFDCWIPAFARMSGGER